MAVVDEARLTHLAYAPEIAQAMLRRQQAEAVIAARAFDSSAERFADFAALESYIDATGGALMRLAATILGGDPASARDASLAYGLTGLLRSPVCPLMPTPNCVRAAKPSVWLWQLAQCWRKSFGPCVLGSLCRRASAPVGGIPVGELANSMARSASILALAAATAAL